MVFGRSIRKIPGPFAVPLLGTAWTYLPLVGSDTTKCLHESYKRKFLKYGKIVREIVAGKEIVSVYDPKDMETVYHNEGKWPQRISHEVLLAVRREYSDLYSSGGIVPTNGEEWANLRSSFQKEISRPSIIAQYGPVIEQTSREFIDYLVKSRDSEFVVPDMIYKMHEWALENVCITVLDTRLDRFGPRRNPMCRDLIEGGKKFLNALNDAEHFPFWRLYKTKAYKTVAEKELFFYEFAKVHVEKKLRTLDDVTRNDESGSVLEKYLKNTKNDLRDVITMASDLVFAGLLTTAFTMSFVLYHLSRNVDVQEKLFVEIRSHLIDDRPLDVSLFGAMKYLKACIKESLRLNPIALGTGRVLTNEVVLSGHHIRPGTIILTQNEVSSKLDEFVSDPLSFRPERWLRDLDERRRIHPYLVLPFGTGPRSCIGRRFAELEMYIFLSLLINNYRVEWVGSDDLKVNSHLLNIPVGRLNVKMTRRDPIE